MIADTVQFLGGRDSATAGENEFIRHPVAGGDTDPGAAADDEIPF